MFQNFTFVYVFTTEDIFVGIKPSLLYFHFSVGSNDLSFETKSSTFSFRNLDKRYLHICCKIRLSPGRQSTDVIREINARRAVLRSRNYLLRLQIRLGLIKSSGSGYSL